MTKDPRLTPARQAKASMSANPYDTKGKNFIHIGGQHPQKHPTKSCCRIHISIDCNSRCFCRCGYSWAEIRRQPQNQPEPQQAVKSRHHLPGEKCFVSVYLVKPFVCYLPMSVTWIFLSRSQAEVSWWAMADTEQEAKYWFPWSFQSPRICCHPSASWPITTQMTMKWCPTLYGWTSKTPAWARWVCLSGLHTQSGHLIGGGGIKQNFDNVSLQ